MAQQYGLDVGGILSNASSGTLNAIKTGDEAKFYHDNKDLMQETQKKGLLAQKSSYELSDYGSRSQLDFAAKQKQSATELGKTQYDVNTLVGQIQQDRAEITNMEKSINDAGLLPKDRQSLEATLQRKKSSLNTTELRYYNQQSKVLSDTAVVLGSVNNQESLDNARSYMKDTYNTEADEAIASGKIHPDQKEKFINDRLARIPNKWDPKTTPHQMDSMMLKGRSFVDALKIKQLEAQQQKSLLAEQHQQLMEKATFARLAMEQKILNQAERKQDSDQVKSARKDQIESLTGQSKSIADDIHSYGTDIKGLQQQLAKDPSISPEEINTIKGTIANYQKIVTGLHEQQVKVREKLKQFGHTDSIDKPSEPTVLETGVVPANAGKSPGKYPYGEGKTIEIYKEKDGSLHYKVLEE